ncbi:hypothetical protein [Poseidonocella sp. HB161398]|uniref:hypothetical protein n=1 Tax=Poseidonocella sp. HB161398 TaxID=2320855 RepID=UPI001107BC50|nr:hypothetical protein [Poseidonocella sp. HB161398]
MTAEGGPLFGTVPQEHWPALARAAVLLIEKALPPGHPWQGYARDDLEALLPGEIPAGTATAEALDAVMACFGKDNPIGGAEFAAFLATRLKSDAHKKTGNRLSAWILAAALQRQRLTPDQNALRQGLNAARMLKDKSPGALEKLDGALGTPKALLEALDRLGRDTVDKTVRGYFKSLAALMRSAIRGGDAVHRERAPAPPAGAVPLREEIRDGHVLIAGGFAPQAEAFGGPAEEQEADRPQSRRAVRLEDDAEDFSPPATARARTRRAIRAQDRRSLSLPAEQDPLTGHEVATLAAWLRTAGDSPGGRALLADLAFGQAMARAESRWDTEGGLPGLRLSVDLPKIEPLVDGGDDGDDRTLFLPAPPGASCPADGRAKDGIIDGAIDAILRDLRPQLARPLTRGRIRRHKADWLRRAGADEAVTGFLTGESPSARAQMHYTRLDREALAGWHLAYLDQGLGLPVAEAPLPPDGCYGSRLWLPPDLLADTFRLARKEVENRSPGGLGSMAQIRAAHNAFALYTLMLLYLATGHRPVTHPFEFRSDFDLEAGLFWVSDKTGRGARGTRMLPLAPRAIAQAEAWIAHLEQLERRLALTHPDEAARVRAALALDEKSRGPFLLRFDQDGTLVPLRPADQQSDFGPVLPAALNWTRHILRSTLAGRCNPAALDAFLGHSHTGESPFVAGSSLGLGDLWPVADAIEDLLASLGANAVRSPL